MSSQERKNIKVNENVFIQLNTLKKKCNHLKFNDTIEMLIKDFESKIEKFIEKNNVEKNQNEQQNLIKKIEELDEFLKKDRASLRKWLGAMEKDYFIKSKIELSKIDNKLSNPNNIENTNNDDDILKSEKLKYEKLLDDYNKNRNEIYLLNEKLKTINQNKLHLKKEFFSHLRKEKDKIYVKLTEQELNDFFKNVY